MSIQCQFIIDYTPEACDNIDISTLRLKELTRCISCSNLRVCLDKSYYRSPDGSVWEQTIDDAGVLSTTKIEQPPP